MKKIKQLKITKTFPATASKDIKFRENRTPFTIIRELK